MFDRAPDYVILSGGGSIADLSGLDIEDPDRVVLEFLERLDRKVRGGCRELLREVKDAEEGPATSCVCPATEDEDAA